MKQQQAVAAATMVATLKPITKQKIVVQYINTDIIKIGFQICLVSAPRSWFPRTTLPTTPTTTFRAPQGSLWALAYDRGSGSSGGGGDDATTTPLTHHQQTPPM